MRMNLEKISPIKRAKIEKGIDLVEQCNENEKIIEKMIIFGSSVTNHCTEDSDIDVCLVSDYTTANNAYFGVHGGLGRVMDDAVDIFNFKQIGEKLK
ncbi:MAG: nucleotidyltransferase domain-containing protein, partial [Desulfovibrio sp.]|nr:nucleotidyltransferase domain-containing protein [Desulfovibrio sp.]